MRLGTCPASAHTRCPLLQGASGIDTRLAGRKGRGMPALLTKLPRGDEDTMSDEQAQASQEAEQQKEQQQIPAVAELSGIAALARRMEALLFVSSRPMSAKRLADLLELESIVPIREAAEYLNEQYAERAFDLRLLAGGYQLLTRPALEEEVLKLQKQRKAQKLTPGALETLAIIAYKQPITRNDVDNIRGVQSDHYIRQLAERHLIRIVGRGGDGSFGGSNPALYGTTTTFLDEFGLKALKELPQEADMLALEEQERAEAEAERQEELEAQAAAREEAEAAAEAEANADDSEEESSSVSVESSVKAPVQAPKKAKPEVEAEFEDDDEDWPDTESEDDFEEEEDDADGPGLEIVEIRQAKKKK